VKDCQVSEWGPWSPCSADLVCGEFGSEERHRVVLHVAVNGGEECPHLVQSRQCLSPPLPQCIQSQDDDDADRSRTQSSTPLLLPETTARGGRGIRGGGGDGVTVATTAKTPINFTTDANILPVAKDDFQPLATLKPLSRTSNNHLLGGGGGGGGDDNYYYNYRQQQRLYSHRDDDEVGCMELVIIKASSGCHHHDQRLHIGTRICVQCKLANQDEDVAEDDDKDDGDEAESCDDLARTSIRKFRINQRCHGKLTYLTKEPTRCNCAKGLRFEVFS